MIPQVSTDSPTATTKMTTIATTAPMSWKDAVSRAPRRMTQASATKVTSMPVTPRAARSRSISRMVAAVAPQPQNRWDRAKSADENNSKPSDKRGTRASSLLRQVSFEAKAIRKDAPLRTVLQPIPDLVDRLGLTEPRLEKERLARDKMKRAACGRPRSASADEVLLRRSSIPLWLLEAQTRADTLRSSGKPMDQSWTPTRFARKGRAMSVPNAALIADCGVHKPVEEDSSDCDDTHSESTSDSSCMSPRHVPMTQFVESHEVNLLDIPERTSFTSVDSFSEFVTPDDEEEDMEAFELLDRINSLAAEFKAHREYEESRALTWSVHHAARQGVVSPQLQQSLLSNIRNGAWEETRDVLYHKCHLVPAVAPVIDHPNQPAMDPRSAVAFEECVERIAPPEPAEARLQKLGALKAMSDLLTSWVKIVGYERGLSEEHITLTRGSLFLAGSYRLGLQDSESDIDAVCVVPCHVTHDDFFSSFCRMLEQTDGVTQLAPVPHAFVPLISLSFRGVSMDLLFARLPITSVEAQQEIDSDHILVGVDPTSTKSLNAPRVSSMLLCLVPRRDVFRIVLRAVRAWARRRGVYSAKMGYLGGISWAILVAFVCQLFPDAEPMKVLVRFFQVFSEWSWPRPIMLNMVYDAGLGHEMWDPRRNLYDRAHIMPIITPAYPYMNSAVQVTPSTYSVIYEELWRARYLAEIAVGPQQPMCPPGAEAVYTAPPDASVEVPMEVASTVSTIAPEFAAATTSLRPWDKLFQPSNFFIRYDSYLVVNFYAATDNSMHAWGKFVHSRLRKLVESLQHVSAISRVHASPCFYPHTGTGRMPGSCMFIGIEFHSRHGALTQAQVRDEPEVKSNLERTIRFFLATDLQQLAEKKDDMGAEATVLDWTELPEFVFPEGRVAAIAERAAYHQDIERMLVQQRPVHFRGHNMDKFGNGMQGGGGKWRSNGRPRNSSGKSKQSRDRYRDANKASYMAQAG